jgi:hypothetical protein
VNRKGNYRKQKNLIVIVSQGLETEPNYFKHFNKCGCSFLLKIKAKGKDPISLIKYAKFLKENEFALSRKDKIYCIYDVNSTSEKSLKDAQELAEKNGLISCISNPCFELWFLLHFAYSTSGFSSYSDVKRDLIKHISRYDKNMDVHDQLLSKQPSAIRHAKELDDHHKRVGICSIRGCNPSTDIYKLVEYLNKLSF